MYLHVSKLQSLLLTLFQVLCNIAGNQTVKEYLETFNKPYNVGPGKGMFSCEKSVVPSGPHYLLIFVCKIYSNNETGHMEKLPVNQ